MKHRKCEQNQVFFKTGDPHPYCKNACEAHTMCGEVEVPEEHLEVCRVCNAFGQNCQSHESSKPAGPGKMMLILEDINKDQNHYNYAFIYKPRLKLKYWVF